MSTNVNGLDMYFSTDRGYCINVNKEGEVLFEIFADCANNLGFLSDGKNI